MTDTDNQRGPMVLSVLDRLLAFITTPWKAVVLVILLIVCGIGALVYDQRVRIADAILTHPSEQPTLLVDRFNKDVGKLLQVTRGDVALLIELHIVSNLSEDRSGWDRYGHPFLPVEGPQTIISPDGSSALLVKFLRNDVVCLDTAGSPNEEAKAMVKAGYMRACVVMVPPVFGIGIGALIVGWKEALEPSVEERSGYAMSAAAMKFATW